MGDAERGEAMAYACEVASRLHALLGDELAGVYGGGSLALGDYRAGRSDLDIAVVCRDELTRAEPRRVPVDEEVLGRDAAAVRASLAQALG